MRTNQITLRFDEDPELGRAWAQIPAAFRTQIALRFARLVVKTTKVDPPELKRKMEQPT